VSGAASRLALIVAAGMATGVISQVLQSILPTGWSQVGNAISPWLAVAFLLASRMPTRAWAVAGAVTALAIATATFYVVTTLRYGMGGGIGATVLYGTGSLAGGVVYGLAGYEWRHGPHVRRAVAIGLLAAVFVAEGLYQAWIQPEPWIGVGFVAAGLLVPLVVGRSRPDRLGGYVAMVPCIALGALGFLVFVWLGEFAGSL
jgi:hypothetical protein